MTPDSTLDTAIRQAQHLLFSFDGAIRRVDAGKAPDSTTTTTPHIHEVLAACRESGRTAAIVRANQSTDVRAYLDAHALTQVSVVAVSIGEAMSALEASPANCLLITGSPTDIKAAQAAGTPIIGYARTSDNAANLVDAGATTFVYSMADLVLSLRTHMLDL
jgi:beta-phosphoglucomutase-like phosphatase (HAD superfamily)